MLAPGAGAASTDWLATCVGTSPCSAQALPTAGVIGSTLETGLGNACYVAYDAPGHRQISLVSVPGVAGVALTSTTTVAGPGPGAGTDYKLQLRVLN